MIAQLRGKIVEIMGRTAIVDCAGVGYEVLCSLALIERLSCNAEATLVIYTDVKESSIKLYGFTDQLEKQVFNLLMRVKGIGARTAIEVVSGIDKRELLRAIGQGDLPRLQSIRGVGKKTAERIVVELKDKVGEAVSELQGNIEVVRTPNLLFNDAIDALQALGFARGDAEQAVTQVQRTGLFNGTKGKFDAGEIVKEALRYI